MAGLLAALAPTLPAAAEPTVDSLAAGFGTPPPETRPACYWYWISDNLSREGITRDLEAMARIGIGEAFIGNVVDPDTPLGNVKLLSEEWFACMVHAAQEARRLGVNLSVFNSPGWSQSGGPWVKPTQAMRYVTASEQRVTGPARFDRKLSPPHETFQDIAVLAFPAPRDDVSNAPVRPAEIQSAPAAAGAAAMVDGDVGTACVFPAGASAAGRSFTIDLSFASPLTARSLTLHPGAGSFSVKCELLVPEDGGGYRLVREFVMDRRGLARPKYAVNVGFMLRGPAVVSFPATTSRRFRLKTTLLAIERGPAVVGSAAAVSEAPGIAEIILSGAARVDRVIEKQLGKMHPTPQPNWNSYVWPAPIEPESADLAVARERIVDLSERMSADGTLRWDVPAGDWIIQRIGMTPTGAENHPTTDEGRGLEVDKMNREAMAAHFDGFVAPYLKRVPDDARKALTRVVIDSYEVGSQNWTDGFHQTFAQAFGYDPRPWLPVLSGRIVGSAGESDRFLWDLRRHVADRIGTEYVGGLREIANRHGLRLWLENYGHWGFPGEFLQYGGQSDDLGGEFWIRDNELASRESTELRAASSAARLYGKKPVYAEAFTSSRSFLEAPGNIKAQGDWAFTHGINQFVLHVYIHQPWADRKPGVNAWFGTEFNRHNTWFEPSKAWIDYLRRCHFLLQRGTSVADVAYFIGEDAPMMTGARQPSLPAGYDYDYINAEVLLTRARVVNGRIAIPDGPSYALLVLPPLDTMRPELIRRIRTLVRDGAAILGAPPRRSPSLQGYPACDQDVARVADEVWGELAKPAGPGLARRTFGQGRVFRGDDLAAVLRELHVTPAVVAPPGIRWTHRREADAEIFFVCNTTPQPVLADITFRATGRAPEFWHPDTGNHEESGWWEATGDGTRVPVSLDGHGAVFVVFRRSAAAGAVARVLHNGAPLAPAKAAVASVTRRTDGALELRARESGVYSLVASNGDERRVAVALPPVIACSNPWTVRFVDGVGPSEGFAWPKLISWSDHDDPAVKYYSGAATYTTRVEIPGDALTPGRRLVLDLGAVEVIAEVRVNGRNLGVLWKKPFAVDITDVARGGGNEIEVRVTNLWNNRLMGDEKLPPEQRATFTTARPRVPRKTLLPSGLLGPVTIGFSETKTHGP